MKYLLRYKVKPSSGWVHGDPLPNEDAALTMANKLVTSGDCCRVEVYQHVMTGTPLEPQIKIEWHTSEDQTDESTDGAGVSSLTTQ